MGRNSFFAEYIQEVIIYHKLKPTKMKQIIILLISIVYAITGYTQGEATIIVTSERHHLPVRIFLPIDDAVHFHPVLAKELNLEPSTPILRNYKVNDFLLLS